MIKIADIFEYKNGNKKIVFFELGIYDLLKVKLGYRYTKINGKEYFLKEKDGIYKTRKFYHLDIDFREYLESNFDNIEINGEIALKDLLNEYFKKRPIKYGNFVRDYLSENFYLSETTRNLILLETEKH